MRPCAPSWPTWSTARRWTTSSAASSTTCRTRLKIAAAERMPRRADAPPSARLAPGHSGLGVVRAPRPRREPMNDAPTQADGLNTDVKTVTPPKAVKVGGRGGGKTAATKKAKAATKPKPKAPKAPSKADTVIALLRREAGATMQEMQEATSWKPHSVRAFISAGLKKKGLQVTKQKHEGGMPTTFHLPEPAEAI